MANTTSKPKRSANGAMELKIEDDIPMPTRYTLGGKSGVITEAIGKLKVGQSVLLPQFTRPAQFGGVRAYCQGKYQIRLASRAVEGGVRVWRIE